MKAILRTYIRAEKLCLDFFFHEQLARLYAEKKKQKADDYFFHEQVKRYRRIKSNKKPNIVDY
jgi:hypothetical protein